MPYASDKQRGFMHAKHPNIAARWDKEIRAAQRKKVSKSFPDAADVHVLGNSGAPKRPKRKGRLRRKK